MCVSVKAKKNTHAGIEKKSPVKKLAEFVSKSEGRAKYRAKKDYVEGGKQKRRLEERQRKLATKTSAQNERNREKVKP